MDKLRKCWKKMGKDILNPKSVYGSHFPLIFSLCCSGLVPYKVVGLNLKRSKWCYLIGGVNQILFAFAFVQTIMKNTSFIECFFQSDISKVGNSIHFVVSFVSMIIIYASCFCQRMKVKKVFDRLFQIDLKLKILSFQQNYRQRFRYNCAALIVVWSVFYLLLIFGISMVYSSKKKFSLHSWVSYFLPNFMVNIIIFMFKCVLKQIRISFDGCNQVTIN